jgi:transaldolase / glucose-6-phosphate isomerase
MQNGPDLVTRWPALELAVKRRRLQRSLHLLPGPVSARLGADSATAARAAAAMWRRDPSGWSAAADVQAIIANRLGWLDSPALMADSIDRLKAFAADVKRDGFTDVVLLGMGGSSLAPEVLRSIIGTASGWPRLHMLDSTDPAAIRAAATTPQQTLYLLASKSGTTIEPNTLAAHFRQTLERAGIARWADHFVAITDEGTELARRARSESFRETFINPSDIGGRYSALSFFGLVPAALMGQDISALIGWGLAMLTAAIDSPETDLGHAGVADNPAVALGLLLGTSARKRRDKLTLLLPPGLESFGLWVEQLVAESTGKNGVGIVPIAGEMAAGPQAYGSDRLFIEVRHGGPDAAAPSTQIVELESAGHPTATIEWHDLTALGAEFVRWEIATAVAGALLEINPFDEPNVKQAKDATTTLLGAYQSQGTLPETKPDLTLGGGIAITASRAAREQLADRTPDALLTLLRTGDYFALLAYVGPSADLAGELARFRNAVRDRTHAATMFGVGPRYLHSTGQLHKGGPNTGVFVLITAATETDLEIPGYPFTFGTLELAQALGDFASLDAAGRRALHVHLPSADGRLIRQMADALLQQIALQ